MTVSQTHRALKQVVTVSLRETFPRQSGASRNRSPPAKTLKTAPRRSSTRPLRPNPGLTPAPMGRGDKNMPWGTLLTLRASVPVQHQHRTLHLPPYSPVLTCLFLEALPGHKLRAVDELREVCLCVVCHRRARQSPFFWLFFSPDLLIHNFYYLAVLQSLESSDTWLT